VGAGKGRRTPRNQPAGIRGATDFDFRADFAAADPGRLHRPVRPGVLRVAPIDDESIGKGYPGFPDAAARELAVRLPDFGRCRVSCHGAAGDIQPGPAHG